MSFSESRYPSTRSKGPELKATQILDLKNPLASLTLGTIYLEPNTYFMIKKTILEEKNSIAGEISPSDGKNPLLSLPYVQFCINDIWEENYCYNSKVWFLECLRWWWWLSLSLIEWVPSLSLPDRLLMSWLHQRRIKLSMNRSLTRLWVDLLL